MLNWLLPLVVACIHVLTATKLQQKLCTDITKECEYDDYCGFAYYRFVSKCPRIVRIGMDFSSSLNLPKFTNCSEDCVEAINDLKDTNIGAYFDDCDCLGDGNCLTTKARVTKCLDPDHESHRKTSCTMTMINCTLNHTCKKLQRRFLRRCTKMISGIKCEEKCLNAQSKLFTDELGKAMADCECDGTNEPYCRAIRAHAEQLRCKPGMDGSGKRNFNYQEETLDTDGIIHSPDDEENERNSGVSVNSCLVSYALVLLSQFVFY